MPKDVVGHIQLAIPLATPTREVSDADFSAQRRDLQRHDAIIVQVTTAEQRTWDLFQKTEHGQYTKVNAAPLPDGHQHTFDDGTPIDQIKVEVLGGALGSDGTLVVELVDFDRA